MRELAMNVARAGKNLDQLLAEAQRAATRGRFQQPLTQDEVNYLVTQYLPLYDEARRQIEIAADALVTDPLN